VCEQFATIATFSKPMNKKTKSEREKERERENKCFNKKLLNKREYLFFLSLTSLSLAFAFALSQYENRPRTHRIRSGSDGAVVGHFRWAFLKLELNRVRQHRYSLPHPLSHTVNSLSHGTWVA